MDEDRMRVRRDYVEVFEQLEWTTVDSIMTTDRVAHVRQKPKHDREIVQLNLPTEVPPLGALPKPSIPAETATPTAWLKRHRCAATEDSTSEGIGEADRVGWLQKAGVPTLNVIAAGAQITGGVEESFFMSEHLHAEPAHEYWQYGMGKPSTNSDHMAKRRRVLAAIARTASRLHRANLFHRDLYWSHFYIDESKDGVVTARLIDLQRILKNPRRRWRWWIKDMGQFRFSTPKGLVSASEIAHWYKCYFGGDHGPRPLTAAELLWCIPIRARAAIQRWRFDRKR
jgi:hypothetical protein